MGKHTIILPSGRRQTLTTLFDAHQIAVCANDTRTGFVVLDLTTNHVFTRAGGSPLRFATTEQACAFVGAMLVTQCCMTLAQALAAIRGEVQP